MKIDSSEEIELNIDKTESPQIKSKVVSLVNNSKPIKTKTTQTQKRKTLNEDTQITLRPHRWP